MTVNDEDVVAIENHLKKFRPRRPRALDLPRTNMKLALGLTVAITAAMLAVGAFLFVRPESNSRGVATHDEHAETKPRITVVQLSPAVREVQSLDAVLSQSARVTLPRTNRPRTALNVLSKE